MKRRTFLAGSIACVGIPLPAASQGLSTKRLGILSPSEQPPEPDPRPFDRRMREAFDAALRMHGWKEGENLIVERRYAGGRLEHLPALAAELVARNVDAIYATTGRAGLAAKAATSTIPIVTRSGDMVRQGLVSNVARPERNVTGLNVISADVGLVAKRLQLLSDVLPRPSRVAVLGCGPPGAPDATKNWAWESTAAAARTLGIELLPYAPQTLEEIEADLRTLRRPHVAGILMFDCPYFNGLDQMIFLRHGLPAMYPFESYAHAGGLMAYGPDPFHLTHRTAWYIDRVLRGTPPAALPVEQTHVRFVINAKTARGIGVNLPQSLLLRADEVLQ